MNKIYPSITKINIAGDAMDANHLALSDCNNFRAIYIVSPYILQKEPRKLWGVPFVGYIGEDFNDLEYVKKLRQTGVPIISHGAVNELTVLVNAGYVGISSFPEYVNINEEKVPINSLMSANVPYAGGKSEKEGITRITSLRNYADYRHIKKSLLEIHAANHFAKVLTTQRPTTNHPNRQSKNRFLKGLAGLFD